MSERTRSRAQHAPIWGATPPAPRRRKYPVLRVIGRQPVECIILADQLEETYTHFEDGRTVFCTGAESGCHLDHRLVGRPRYGAWLAVQQLAVRVTLLVRLTSVAVSVEPRLRSLAGDLRGRKIALWRVNGHEQSEMHARVSVDRVADVSDLLPVPDVRFAVEHMLAAEDRPAAGKKPRWSPLSAAFAAQSAEQDKGGAK